MFETLLALLTRLVVAIEKLAASPVTGNPPADNAEPEIKPKKPRGSNKAADTAATGDAASKPAPSADVSAEKKHDPVTKEQVRALLQQLGELKTVAFALGITKQFATTNLNAKGQQYTGESIGTVDPEKYAEAAAALGKAIAEATKAKADAANAAAEANPLDD